MNVEPIIDARFKRFRESYDLHEVAQEEAFERFVNHAILSAHQPDAFDADAELLDTICVGGPNDMGIDGLGIKLNGLFVSSKEEIDDITEKFKRATVEFVFVQSKYGRNFDTSSFVQFASGIRDFLRNENRHPANEKIKAAMNLKEYLLSDSVVAVWDSNPAVRVYFVSMADMEKSSHLSAHCEDLVGSVEAISTYGSCRVHLVNAEALKRICDNNENAFSATVEAIDIMQLTAVEGVDNSCIVLCNANEYLNLLTTDDGVIRKSLFNDNVRDFQGSNSVNMEIESTVISEPEKFGLFNNGITVVCDEFLTSNRRITIKNPQIVNGCQTSHVLFYAREGGKSVDEIPLQIKIIATNDLAITNQIVRSTNRQNIVYDEAFEATRQFHKDLEEFFTVLGNKYGSVHYERRSKQYQHDPRIKQTDKVNIRILTQFFVGVFLNRPHMSHRHEAKLLSEFGNQIYQEHQSKLPYFTTAILFVKMERLFRRGDFSKGQYYSFRAHIAMLFRELECGPVPSINDVKKIDKYCMLLLESIQEDSRVEIGIKKAINAFDSAQEKWVTDLGRSRDGMKDVSGFTNLLLSHGGHTSDSEEPNDSDSYGKVIKVIVDRNGEQCGFIRRTGNDNLFFHFLQNRNLNFSELEGVVVSYVVKRDGRDGREYAIDVTPVEH